MDSRLTALPVVLAVALLGGCGDLLSKVKEDPKEAAIKKGKDNADAALQGKDGYAKLLGDYIRVSGYNWVVLEGVALVTNLDGTGENPPPSPLRAMLLEDMKKRRVEDPNALLQSKDTSMVIVRGYLPPLIRKGEFFDVDVTLPDGAKTTSLQGGWVMPCELREHAYIQGGGTREGKVMAHAKGAILLATGEGDMKYEAANMRTGTLPGGGVYTMTGLRKLTALVRNDYRSARLTHKIATRIGERFHDFDEHGMQKPLAEALTDLKIELTVPEKYRNNYPRYLQTIRNIALRETPVERHLRIKSLKDDLFVAEKCEEAALQLEAIGTESAPILKDALKASELECRFRAAEALAYLGDSNCVEVLHEAADKEPAFRVFSLVALSTLNDGAAFNALTKLMDHDSMETRYGAFRSLSEANPDDPNVQGEKFAGGYSMHVLETQGPPMIHLTRRRKAEIALFGSQQRFSTPIVLRAGGKIMIKGDAGSDHITVVRIAANEPRQAREVSTKVSDVIRACAELDAGYPDIVQMLVQAEHNFNLPGKVAIDEMPRAGRVYVRHQAGGNGGTAEAQIGSENQLPNIFDSSGRPSSMLPAEDLEADEPPPSKDAKAKSDPIMADLDATTNTDRSSKKK